jgi:mercuric ion transport protein
MAAGEMQNREAPQASRARGAILLTTIGLGAAFGAASCCALPLLLASAGLGTAWLSGIAWLAAPHQVWLIAVAAFSLAASAALLWQQQRAVAGASGRACARPSPSVRRFVALGLVLGLALLSLGYLYV